MTEELLLIVHTAPKEDGTQTFHLLTKNLTTRADAVQDLIDYFVTEIVTKNQKNRRGKIEMSVLSKVLSIGGLAWAAASISTVYFVVCAHNQKRVHKALSRTQRQTPTQQGVKWGICIALPIFSF